MTRLPRSTPEAQGISSATLLELVDRLDASSSELHSLMVLRHGQVVAEGWWPPYAADIPHLLYSVSKSFTSMAVGLVVAEGKLSVDDKAVSFFPGHLPAEVSDNLAAMTVRDLLTMTTGHTEEPTHPRGLLTSGLTAFFAAPVEKQPGTHFLYNTPSTYVLSAIVQQLTGLTTYDFLQERLFGPLGITEATWGSSAEGITYGGFGLSLTTESLARFGQLLLDGGGDLLPADWIAEATSKQVPNDTQDNPDWQQGYGYQFWRSRHGFRADGAFGQFCLVLPDADTVVVTTAATGEMQEVLDIVWSVLLDGAASDVLLPADTDAHRRLTERLATLRLDPPSGSTVIPEWLAGRSYVVDNSDGNGLERIDLGTEITVTIGFGSNGIGSADSDTIVCGPGEWRDQAVRVDDLDRAVASAVWDTDDRLVVTVRFIGTPFCHTFACRFADDRVEVEGSVNVVIGGMDQHFTQTGRTA